MALALIKVKIMPESPDTDLEKVKKEISKKIEIKDSKLEPLAFGLKVLRILVVVPDKSIENLENEIKSVKGVSEAEIESSTLI